MIGGVNCHMLPHLLLGPPPQCKQALWKNNKYAKRNLPKSVMHVQIVVSLIIRIAFLPFLLLKLPIVVIPKFCYRGSVTSHFSSLFEVAWRLTNKTVSRQKLWVGNIAKSMTSEGSGAMLSANVDVYFHEMSNVEMW